MTTSEKSTAKRDVATTATSDNAFPGLQNYLTQRLATLREASGGKKEPSVAIVGPGAFGKGGVYPPQVEETYRSVQDTGGGDLHVFHYGRPDLHGKQDAESWNTRVHNHNFDLMKPDANDTVKSDVVVATRVMGEVMRAVPHGPKREEGRKGALDALLSKGTEHAEYLVDRDSVVEFHRTLGMRKGDYSAFTQVTDAARPVFSFTRASLDPGAKEKPGVTFSGRNAPQHTADAFEQPRAMTPRRAVSARAGARSDFSALQQHEQGAQSRRNHRVHR